MSKISQIFMTKTLLFKPLKGGLYHLPITQVRQCNICSTLSIVFIRVEINRKWRGSLASLDREQLQLQHAYLHEPACVLMKYRSIFFDFLFSAMLSSFNENQERDCRVQERIGYVIYNRLAELRRGRKEFLLFPRESLCYFSGLMISVVLKFILHTS